MSFICSSTTLPRWGDVEFTANVTTGRRAPLPTSEASYQDGGDPGEVELLSVRDVDGVELLGNTFAPCLLDDPELARLTDRALDAALNAA